MPKMCAIPQLVSAPLNTIPIAEHFRGSHPQCKHNHGQHTITNNYSSKSRGIVATEPQSGEVNIPKATIYRD